MGRAIRMVAVALIMLVLPVIVPSAGTLATQDADCDGIDAYIVEIQDVAAQLETATSNFEESDLENWTSDDYIAVSEAIAAVTTSFEEIDVPPAAESFHELLIQQFGLLSQMFDTMSTTGIFGALIYADQLNTLGEQLETAAAEIETACGSDLASALDIGSTDEAVATVSAETVDSSGNADDTPAEGALGTRANPIPMGEAVQLDDDWELTVLSVEPDATDSILAEDSFADPPASGHQFFVATVRVTYIGETSEEFYGWNLRTVGQSAVSYDQFDNSCGWSVPNELPSNELFTGGTIEGNLCWSIDSADADSLVLYDGDQRGSDRIFLSLMPSSSTATPVPAVATPGTPTTPDAAGDQKSA